MKKTLRISLSLITFVFYSFYRFKTLVRDSDGDEYKPDKFTGGMADQFVFIVIMTAEVPPPDAGTNMFFILVQ